MLIGCSQQGLAHYQSGAANADSYRLGSVGGRAWLVVADGLGSRPLSFNGSRIATSAVERHLAGNPEPATPALMRNAFAAAHAEIASAAKAEGHEPGDYATTLTALLLEGDTAVSGAIGDSSIAAYSVHDDNGEDDILFSLCSSDQSEENHRTHVITAPGWEAHAAFNTTISTHLTAIVLTTDGADNFYLRYSPDDEGPVFSPHILRHFAKGLAKLSAPNFFAFFSNFLQQYKADNHDDRTILIAYRVPREYAPPAAQSRRL
jgi:hypothetical protein